MVGTLGHPLSARPLEGLETEVSYMDGQPCLYDVDPIKTPDTKAGVSIPGWQYTLSVVMHCCGKKLVLFTQLHWEGTPGHSGLVFP